MIADPKPWRARILRGPFNDLFGRSLNSPISFQPPPLPLRIKALLSLWLVQLRPGPPVRFLIGWLFNQALGGQLLASFIQSGAVCNAHSEPYGPIPILSSLGTVC